MVTKTFICRPYIPKDMQVVVTIRIYGYMETSNTINKGYRDKIIKKFLLKINILKKLKRVG